MNGVVGNNLQQVFINRNKEFAVSVLYSKEVDITFPKNDHSLSPNAGYKRSRGVAIFSRVVEKRRGRILVISDF